MHLKTWHVLSIWRKRFCSDEATESQVCNRPLAAAIRLLGRCRCLSPAQRTANFKHLGSQQTTNKSHTQYHVPLLRPPKLERLFNSGKLVCEPGYARLAGYVYMLYPGPPASFAYL